MIIVSYTNGRFWINIYLDRRKKIKFPIFSHSANSCENTILTPCNSANILIRILILHNLVVVGIWWRNKEYNMHKLSGNTVKQCSNSANLAEKLAKSWNFNFIQKQNLSIGTDRFKQLTIRYHDPIQKNYQNLESWPVVAFLPFCVNWAPMFA